ncbi:hypothetical protein OPV22_017882 [Ensete ventricosum]|uniref:Uncharacterized protein n=1 Tax=Ensete ventricosum TaxID=4639 RepID=A0AAV8R205_ENSVE|nr:hypothetical protein OPV22_017882 [Ensete ventricosum]
MRNCVTWQLNTSHRSSACDVVKLRRWSLHVEGWPWPYPLSHPSSSVIDPPPTLPKIAAGRNAITASSLVPNENVENERGPRLLKADIFKFSPMNSWLQEYRAASTDFCCFQNGGCVVDKEDSNGEERVHQAFCFIGVARKGRMSFDYRGSFGHSNARKGICEIKNHQRGSCGHSKAKKGYCQIKNH